MLLLKMKIALLLLLSFVISTVENTPSENALSRSKRSLVNMARMMRCTTGRSSLKYNKYGCFCGRGGSGTPVDDIDKCCQEHDICYKNTGCSWLKLTLLHYKWSCNNGNPVCKPASGWFRFLYKCKKRACDCDREFALCLKQHPYPSTGKPSCPSK